jgi:hypothetical protein
MVNFEGGRRRVRRESGRTHLTVPPGAGCERMCHWHARMDGLASIGPQQVQEPAMPHCMPMYHPTLFLIHTSEIVPYQGLMS